MERQLKPLPTWPRVLSSMAVRGFMLPAAIWATCFTSSFQPFTPLFRQLAYLAHDTTHHGRHGVQVASGCVGQLLHHWLLQLHRGLLSQLLGC